jgi:hypothetical protein
MTNDHGRPRTVFAFAAFFLAGSAIACISAFAIAFPGTFLDAMWQLNPRARQGFASMGSPAVLLMVVVSASCFAAAFGFWTGRRWGYFAGIALLLVNLIGDGANVLLGTEPRAAIGIPIVLILLWLLSRPAVRAWFK